MDTFLSCVRFLLQRLLITVTKCFFVRYIITLLNMTIFCNCYPDSFSSIELAEIHFT